MSNSDLLWELTKRSSSYIVRRDGIEFSRDPLNLTSKNAFKYSGLANPKALGVSGKVLSLKTKKGTKSITFKKPSPKSVANIVSQYRPDLVNDAVKRVKVAFRAPAAVKARKARTSRK